MRVCVCVCVCVCVRARHPPFTSAYCMCVYVLSPPDRGAGRSGAAGRVWRNAAKDAARLFTSEFGNDGSKLMRMNQDGFKKVLCFVPPSLASTPHSMLTYELTFTHTHSHTHTPALTPSLPHSPSLWFASFCAQLCLQSKARLRKNLKALADKWKGSTLLKDYSPWLAGYRCPSTEFEIEIPGQYGGAEMLVAFFWGGG